MNIFKSGAKLSGSIIIAAVLSFFLCISIGVICTSLFTDYVGYDAYVYTKDSDEPIAQYKYFYIDTDGDGKADGTDAKKAAYEDEGYIVTTYKVRSVLEGTSRTVFLSVTQILNLILVISFASSSVYKQGFKDANLVRTGHINADSLKGFKTGLIANIPFFTLFVLLVILYLGIAPKFLMTWYGYLNSHLYSLIFLISGCSNGVTVSELSVLQFVLLFLSQFIVPAISGVAYILGFKEINFTDKLVYKKG